jgi:hypothetical protein
MKIKLSKKCQNIFGIETANVLDEAITLTV